MAVRIIPAFVHALERRGYLLLMAFLFFLTHIIDIDFTVFAKKNREKYITYRIFCIFAAPIGVLWLFMAPQKSAKYLIWPKTLELIKKN